MPYKKKVTKHPDDCDATLDLVLDKVEFFTADGDKLTDHSIGDQQVTLTFTEAKSDGD